MPHDPSSVNQQARILFLPAFRFRTNRGLARLEPYAAPSAAVGESPHARVVRLVWTSSCCRVDGGAMRAVVATLYTKML